MGNRKIVQEPELPEWLLWDAVFGLVTFALPTDAHTIYIGLAHREGDKWRPFLHEYTDKAAYFSSWVPAAIAFLECELERKVFHYPTTPVYLEALLVRLQDWEEGKGVTPEATPSPSWAGESQPTQTS